VKFLPHCERLSDQFSDLGLSHGDAAQMLRFPLQFHSRYKAEELGVSSFYVIE
jgi:hypothetical protein